MIHYTGHQSRIATRMTYSSIMFVDIPQRTEKTRKAKSAKSSINFRPKTAQNLANIVKKPRNLRVGRGN